MEEQPLTIKHISYSYLHLLACPFAAFLRYQAAVRTPTTPWLALGNALHHAIEKGHAPDFRLDVAIDLFKKELSRIVDEENVNIGWPQLKKIEAEGIEMLGGYYAKVEAGAIASKPLVLEQEFRIPFEGIEIVGRIDKVERDNGYIITDFKSGKAEPTEWFLRHDLQLTAYAWACQELYGELPLKVVWHHLRNGKLIESVRTQEDIDDLKTLVHNAIIMNRQGMKHRIFHKDVCGMCDYQGAMCDDKELERSVTEKINNGERVEPQMYIRARRW